MSADLRDVFAAHALTGLIGGRSWDATPGNVFKNWARASYAAADAMLEYRKTSEDSGAVDNSAEQLKAAIALVRERAEELFLEEGQFDTLEKYLDLLAQRAAV